MRGKGLRKFNECYKTLLNESVRASFYNRFSKVKAISEGIPTIEQIKNELLKLSGLKTWQDF